MLLQLQVTDRHICHCFALNKSPLIEVKVVTLCCSGPAVHSTTWHYLRNIDIWHFTINLFSSKQKDEKSMETLTWNWQTEDCTTRQSPWMVVRWNKALQFLSCRVWREIEWNALQRRRWVTHTSLSVRVLSLWTRFHFTLSGVRFHMLFTGCSTLQWRSVL